MFSSLVIGVPDENIFGHRCTCLKYIWQGSILFNVEVNFVDIINIPWFIWLMLNDIFRSTCVVKGSSPTNR